MNWLKSFLGYLTVVRLLFKFWQLWITLRNFSSWLWSWSIQPEKKTRNLEWRFVCRLAIGFQVPEASWILKNIAKRMTNELVLCKIVDLAAFSKHIQVHVLKQSRKPVKNQRIVSGVIYEIIFTCVCSSVDWLNMRQMSWWRGYSWGLHRDSKNG